MKLGCGRVEAETAAGVMVRTAALLTGCEEETNTWATPASIAQASGLRQSAKRLRSLVQAIVGGGCMVTLNCAD